MAPICSGPSITKQRIKPSATARAQHGIQLSDSTGTGYVDRSTMSTDAIRMDKQPLALFTSLIMASALINAWSMLDWIDGSEAAWAVVGYKIGLRTSMAVFFLILSVAPIRRQLVEARVTMAALAGCAVLASAVKACLLVSGSAVLVYPISIIVGAGFALSIYFTLSVLQRCCWEILFPSMLLATGIGNLMSVGIDGVGLSSSPLMGLALPLAAAGIIGYADKEGLLVVNSNSGEKRRAKTSERRCLTGGILLCSFAGGVASAATTMGNSHATYLTGLIILGIAPLLFLGKTPRDTLLFSFLVLFTCACGIVAFIVPASAAWTLALERTGFWVLMLYGLAWFSHQGTCDRDAALSQTALRGLGVLYLVSSLADAVSFVTDGQTALVVSLGTLVASLVVVLLGTGVAPTNAAVDDAAEDAAALQGVEAPAGGSFEAAVAALAESGGLTASERDMLSCLAKGYSLKRASEQMFMSESTAKYHRHNLYLKLNVSSRQELIDMVESVPSLPTSEASDRAND